MAIYRNTFLLTFFCLFFGQLNAQKNDSLWDVWVDTEQHDTARAEAMQYYAWSYLFVNTDSAIYFGNLELEFSQKTMLPKWVAKAYNTIGLAYMYQGKYDSSLTYLERSLAYRKALGSKSDIGGSYGNIGIVYQEISNFPVAIDYFMKSLYYKEEMNDSIGIANTCNNIGLLYTKLKEYDQVQIYHNKSLRIYKALGNKRGIARVHNNLGALSIQLQDFESAEQNLKISLDISKEINDKHAAAATYLSLSSLYLLDDFNQNSTNRNEILATSFEYMQASYQLYSELQEPRGMIKILNHKAEYYLIVSQLNNAKTSALEAKNIGLQYGYFSELTSTYEILFQIEQKKGNYKAALDYKLRHSAIKDSLFGIKNEKEIYRNEVKFQFEKQAAEDSLESVKNQEIAAAKFSAQKKLLDKEQSIKYLAFGFIVVLCISAFLIYRRYKITKTQKDIIEHQKIEVGLQHKEILDSIQYAQRLQTAILPQKEDIHNFFTDSFLLFKPKDVVSGDFYWFEVIDETAYVAVADCTGHGVPGAMVSIVCSNALNKTLIEEGITEPSKILDRARQLVIENFEKSSENLKDGMDISLCAIKKSKDNTTIVRWAGANNPLWVLSKDKDDLLEIKGDKQPIGKYENLTPFTQHELEMADGDSLFIFTDGFADQFGGVNVKTTNSTGKKFKSKPFKKLLLSQKNVNMTIQKEFIQTTFETWQGDLEQVDDVCILGIRF